MPVNNKPCKVTKEESGIRLDKFISFHTENLSFVSIQKLLRTGQIRINGKRALGSKRIEVGNLIRIPYNYRNLKKSKFYTYNELEEDYKVFINNGILYKDNEIIAVNKPSGFAVQGGSRINNHIDRILDYFRFESPYRPQLLHRLDKDTSGVLLLSRKPDTTRRLAEAFKNRKIKKLYWAFVIGYMPKTSGSINAPLGTLSSKNYEKTIYDINGKESKTVYNVLWKGIFNKIKISLVEFSPETGRKHQIRAHCNYLDCSIMGDYKYVKDYSKNLKYLDIFPQNMQLHAREISVPDSEGLSIRIKASIPNHMLKVFDILKLSEDKIGS